MLTSKLMLKVQIKTISRINSRLMRRSIENKNNNSSIYLKKIDVETRLKELRCDVSKVTELYKCYNE